MSETILELTTFEAKFLVDALNYCKKKLPIDEFILWGVCYDLEKKIRGQVI